MLRWNLLKTFLPGKSYRKCEQVTGPTFRINAMMPPIVRRVTLRCAYDHSISSPSDLLCVSQVESHDSSEAGPSGLFSAAIGTR